MRENRFFADKSHPGCVWMKEKGAECQIVRIWHFDGKTLSLPR
ncbi:hypothetical protein HMPREF9441_00657 [Paraprevotella clara YIT 11840]|uniref:Uncharacterized protein n=1 Tax=Paraprevotella clara YIT 11840 TaxID=762968 RepID=G5SMT0_9BACT|nr:hypothetical protein HMPREF9441_00657 [Paraprevotella clara YIT 11840]